MCKVTVLDNDAFRSVVMRCTSHRHIMRELGLTGRGRSFYAVRDRIDTLGIDTSHFENERKQRLFGATPLEEILVECSDYSASQLKKRLIVAGLLEDVCCKCGVGPEWYGQPLTLQLDHKNGNHRDHRLFNLQIMCPNCHSQTHNWGGRAQRLPTKRCTDCAATISRGNKSGFCKTCVRIRSAHTQSKLPAITLLELERMVSDTNYSIVGRTFGVSRQTVYKWLRRLRKSNIPAPI